MIEFFESRTIFLTLGSIHIYWYGVMYFLAFWIAWFFLPRLGNMRKIVLSRDQWTNIVALGALGVLLGGRIGYALFYDPLFFFAHPAEILKIWHGGMSSHGGFIGAALGVWWATRNFSPSYEGEPAWPVGRREGVSVLAIADVLAIPAALGLALGRIGNIINQEFGIYPYYEAAGDMLIAIVCYAMLRRERGTKTGFIFAMFLFLYSIQRFLFEYIRPQEWPLAFGLSRGQILTIPLLIAAVIVLVRAYKRPI